MRQAIVTAALLAVFCSPAMAQNATTSRPLSVGERTDGKNGHNEEYRDNDERHYGFDPLALSFGAYSMIWDGIDDPGWGAGGKLDLQVMELLSLEARGGWIDDVQAGHDGGKLDLVPIDLGIALHMPSEWLGDHEVPLRPFAMGGASYVFADANDGYETDDEAGWYAGGGIEIGQRKGLGLLLEVMYRGVDIDIDRDNGKSEDANVDGVAANAGVYYRW